MEKTCTCGSCKEPCAKNISLFFQHYPLRSC